MSLIKTTILKRLFLAGIFLLFLPYLSEGKDLGVAFLDQNLDIITVKKTGLYPEGITYNYKINKFLISSFAEGTIYAVDEQGNTEPFIVDDRLISTFGLHIDNKYNRLYVATSDIGVRNRKHPEGQKFAAIGIYNPDTAEVINFVDLGSLLPNDKHLANSITTDDLGNAYVTDSYAPIIYKIDPIGNASIFLKSDKFRGEGINLNGIIYHPDGYLITIKKSDGLLFKIPLDDPESFSQVQIEKKFLAADYLILTNSNELIVTTNHSKDKIIDTAYSLASANNWQSAKIISMKEHPGDIYMTTGTIKNNKIFILYSYIYKFLQTPAHKRKELKDQAVIQQIGVISK
jgi:hypothetical protein